MRVSADTLLGIVPSRLPMLRRRRVASLAEGMAVRLLERAVGTAERLGDAMRVVERAWSTRHEIAAVLGNRRVAEVTVLEARSVPVSRDEPKGEPPSPAVAPTNPPEESVAWALARHLATMVEQRKKTLDVDPWAAQSDRVDAVRQMRIASRRLRVFVELFAPDLPPKAARRTRRSLRRVGRALGPLRELDAHVAMLEALRAGGRTPEQRAAIEHVLEQVERHRDRAQARARKRLGAIDWTRLRTDIEAITDRIVGPLVRADLDVDAWVGQRLRPRLEQAFARMPDLRTTSDFEALHEVRIQAKRMRYAIDLVRPALGGAQADLRKRLRRAQRVLGEHRDSTQLHDLLTHLRSQLDARGRAALSDALAGGIEAIEGRRVSVEARIGAVISEIRAARAKLLSEAEQPSQSTLGSTSDLG
jgi:CHAD domain-containing protein